MQNLRSSIKDGAHAYVVEPWRPNYWTEREFLESVTLFFYFDGNSWQTIYVTLCFYFYKLPLFCSQAEYNLSASWSFVSWAAVVIKLN